MPFDPHVHVGVGVIIRNPEGRLLVIQRKGAHGAGQWSLPGGWIDFGETPEKAALRELAEEVGMIGLAPRLIDATTSVFEDPVGTCVTLFYQVPYTIDTMSAKRLEVDKIENLLWKYRLELSEMDVFPPLQTFLLRNKPLVY